MLESIKKIIRESACLGYWYKRVSYFKSYWLAHPWMSDRRYIKRVYRKRFGKTLDLYNPKGFNEKNNWRKLYDRKPIYTDMVDKCKAKDYIASILGPGHSFKLINSWKNPKDIDIDSLPDAFVLKCNHAGGVRICRSKSTFDSKNAIEKLSEELKKDYFIFSREWPYKDVERCVICEEYMGEELVDYKVYCFNGKPQYIFVWSNHPKEDGTKPQALFCGAYTTDWKRDYSIDIDYPSEDIEYQRPKCLNELLRNAELLSQGTLFLRVDCYIINDKPYVGEMTFFPWGGFMKFANDVVDLRLGQLEQLPRE